MRRRSFLKSALLAPLAALAAVSAFVQACGGGDDSPPYLGGGAAFCDGEMATNVGITNAHTHAVCVSAALLASPPPGGAMVELQYSAGHTHLITLSQAEIQQVGGTTMFSKMSNPDGLHQHNVTFN